MAFGHHRRRVSRRQLRRRQLRRDVGGLNEVREDRGELLHLPVKASTDEPRIRQRVLDARQSKIAGLIAGSVALTGFGLDSAIEGAASVIVI